MSSFYSVDHAGIKQPNRSPVEKIADLAEPLTSREPRSSRTLSMTGTGDRIRTDFGETVKPGSTKTGEVGSYAIWYKITQDNTTRMLQILYQYMYDIAWLYDMVVIESIEGGNIQHRYRIHWRLGLHGVAGLRSTRAGSGCREGPSDVLRIFVSSGCFFFKLSVYVSITYPLSRWSWRSPAAACGWNLWPTPKRHRDTAEASHKTSGLKVLMWRFSLYFLRTQLLERLERPSLMIPTLCQMIPSTSITLNPNLDLQVKVSLARALIMNPDLFLGFLVGRLVVPILASPLTATEVGVASSLPPLRPWNRRFDYQCFLVTILRTCFSENEVSEDSRKVVFVSIFLGLRVMCWCEIDMTFLTVQYYIWIIHDVWCILCVDICRYFSIGHYRHFSPGHQGSSRESWSLPASRHTVPLQKIRIFAVVPNSHFIVCQAFLFVKRFSLESELD